jgi:hypothetical protein
LATVTLNVLAETTLIVTAHVAVTPPQLAVTVAVPWAIPRTSPVETVATFALLVLQVID